jgi:hypothetical protein
MVFITMLCSPLEEKEEKRGEKNAKKIYNVVREGVLCLTV